MDFILHVSNKVYFSVRFHGMTRNESVTIFDLRFDSNY